MKGAVCQKLVLCLLHEYLWHCHIYIYILAFLSNLFWQHFSWSSLAITRTPRPQNPVNLDPCICYSQSVKPVITRND